MPAVLRTNEGGAETLFHVHTPPTVTVRVPKDAVTRYLTGNQPYLSEERTEGKTSEPETPYLRSYTNPRFLKGWTPPTEFPGETMDRLGYYDPVVREFLERNHIHSDVWACYQMLGKNPVTDLADSVVPWTAIPGILGVSYIERHPWYHVPGNGIHMFEIDSGWFEATDTYQFLYGKDKSRSFEDPDFPIRHRLACMFTDIISSFIETNARYRCGAGSVRGSNVPLLRFEGCLGFAQNYIIISDAKISAYFDNHDIGFSINPETGEFWDLGDPAEEEFEACLTMTGNWLYPSNMPYRSRSEINRRILPGMRFSDLFMEHGTRAIAEYILGQTFDWSDRVSCDTPNIPFAALAGWRRIKRTTPDQFHDYGAEYSSTTDALILPAHTDIKQLVDALRDRYSLGSTIRQNGICLTTTSEAVKNEDHHILECFPGNKKTVIPHSRRRWAEPEHKLVYTVANATELRSYLVEGQEGVADRDSSIAGLNYWDFLMKMGALVEGFNAWTKNAQKEDAKVIRQWEKKNPNGKLPWNPFDHFWNIKLVVTS